MKLKKEKVDKIIRITKEYFRTGDTDILTELRSVGMCLILSRETTLDVVHLIEDLAKFTQNSGRGTYNDIYKALEAFGVIVE